MVPYALGQSIDFKRDDGPRLSEFNYEIFLKKDKKDFLRKLSPVYKAIDITRKKLNKKKSLICFVGAPWTLLIYMLDLKKDNFSINQEKLENISTRINRIINKLIELLCIHIK